MQVRGHLPHAGAAAAASMLFASHALAMDTTSWPSDSEPRQIPYFLVMVGDCNYPAGAPYPRAGLPTCSREAWLSLLKKKGVGELQAPPGGRAYRVIWDNSGNGGYWQLIVDANGLGLLSGSSTGKSAASVALKSEEITAFEASLEKSGFATMVSDDDSHGLDDCPDSLIEAIVNGRYHFVRRGCGFPEPIYAATQLIERRKH